MEQNTLAAPFTLEGVGIHTGAHGKVTVSPAEADTGRVFRVGQTAIPAQAAYVVDTARCTTLGRDGARVSTVEHLLSALHGLSIDNALIEVTGPEIPILDGSALPFVEAIRAAGIRAQGRPPRRLALRGPVELGEGKSRISGQPADDFMVLALTEFDEWPEGKSGRRMWPGPDAAATFAREVAPARTFAFRHEVEALLAAGLAQGGSLENALIIAPPDGFSSPLRLPQEWGAHKLLDLIGDLALLDARLAMEVTALRPGHRLNVRFANELLQQAQQA